MISSFFFFFFGQVKFLQELKEVQFMYGPLALSNLNLHLSYRYH